MEILFLIEIGGVVEWEPWDEVISTESNVRMTSPSERTVVAERYIVFVILLRDCTE